MSEQGGRADPATGLQERARSFASELLALAPRSPDFAAKVASVTSMGEPDVRAAAALSDRFLTRDTVWGQPAGGARGGPGRPDAQGLVAATLARLREVVTRLDPSGAATGGLRRLLRRLPGNDPLTDYFGGFVSAQDELDAILVDLLAGQDSLRHDNAVIEAERATARDVLARLAQYDELSARIDTILSDEASRLEAAGQADDATIVRAEAVSAVRRRRLDLATSSSVTAQGQLVLEVVRDTNLDLIRGVDRAQRTTLVALRTAVAVAEARHHQSLVLDRITGLGAVTEAALAPGSSPDDLGRLTTAFDEVRTSLDAIDDVRARAHATLEAARR